MAQIGSFARNDDGAFAAAIRTLNINTKANIKPIAKDGERSPPTSASPPPTASK